MLLKLGKSGRTARIAEFVDTEDPQYDIIDFGIQHANGGIDSVAFGGSFYSLKRAINDANKAAHAPVTDADIKAPVAVTQPVAAVVDRSGDLVDVEGL